jgi:hypothetical protein
VVVTKLDLRAAAAFLETVPEGYWTSYGDVAANGVTAAQPRGTLRTVSVASRLREILHAIRGARVPPAPKRRYDLMSEAMAGPFGESGGHGRVRAGGTTDDDHEDCPPT